MVGAIGLIETVGLTGAVEALDVALKSANVKFLSIDFIKDGIVSIVITGDVCAVKVSIENSEIATKKLGCYLSSNVIPRPDVSILGLINRNKLNIEKVKCDTKNKVINVEEALCTIEPKVSDEIDKNKSLNELKVSELKEYINKNISGYSKSELKKMNKKKLIDLIVKYENY